MKFYGDYWMQAYPEQLKRLAEGKIARMDGKLFQVCPKCRKAVRLNKPFFGDLHFCTEGEG